jgi:phosphate ABC transporter membrane protein 2, PhoT family (TC 3.A.1.7.1)
MMNRHLVQRLGFILLGVISLIVVLPILFVVGNIVVQGLGAINWEFLTAMPRHGMKEGGIFPAIVGTLLLVLGTAVVAIPVGIGGAIYLAEYARDTL